MSSISHWITTKSALTNSEKKISFTFALRCFYSPFWRKRISQSESTSRQAGTAKHTSSAKNMGLELEIRQYEQTGVCPNRICNAIQSSIEHDIVCSALFLFFFFFFCFSFEFGITCLSRSFTIPMPIRISCKFQQSKYHLNASIHRNFFLNRKLYCVSQM